MSGNLAAGIGSFLNGTLDDAAQSIINIGPGVLGGAIGGEVLNFASVLLGGPRIIGILLPDVTIREDHEDRMTVTRHPVERGTPISDHAYLEPAGLTMEVAWSDASDSILSARGAYAALLALQAQAEPFFVMTGKRLYRDMLIESISATTDFKTENALFATIRLTQVRIVQAELIDFPLEENQAEPAQTAATQETGPRQAVPRRQSGLKQLGGLGGLLAGIGG